jgi:hypothetical protein
MPIDETCSATSPEGDKQQMGVFQQPAIPEKRVYQKQTDLFSMPQVVSS